MIVDLAAGSLVVIGILIAALGMFVGGSIAVAGVGLAAIAAGGVLALLASRSRSAT